ncbi:transcriptional regulator [Salinibacterium sp. NG253]|uniref:helix-turn-helix transcriptional regulator n=1 Tax=Salinibacterium sp. NG253 TaxID=2792039 RepID=UPI0018CD1036|nr:PAS domain-containing protein [Salinibacterium sp. NG253]MBH0117649.1 transcriptional regulator [Salinibacterium sp. NG253]
MDRARSDDYESSASHELSADGERVLELFAGLVEPLWRSLSTDSEVVLHEIRLLPNSVVAIAGTVTGRQVGDPATDLLLEQLRNVDRVQNNIDYQSVLPDGRRLRSSTMIVRDSGGIPVAALCINTDISDWLTAQEQVDAMVLGRASSARSRPPARLESPAVPAGERGKSERGESFPRSVDELVSELIGSAIENTGVPVELMKKQHKLAVVEQLEARGLFLLKDAVEVIAVALGVTRFTIYNYLNELAAAGKSEKS